MNSARFKQNFRKYKNLKEQKAFTLIEMLVVIVVLLIIGMAFITITRPEKQKQRAQNSAARAMLVKYAFAADLQHGSKGRLPSGVELAREIPGSVYEAGNCGNTTFDCVFSNASIGLPYKCTTNDPNDYSPTGTLECYFKSVPHPDYESRFGYFRIWGIKHDVDGGEFYYVNDSENGLFECAMSLGDPDLWSGSGALTQDELNSECTKLK